MAFGAPRHRGRQVDGAGGSNPWLSRRVLAYAHQGGAREAPASTLAAIERALRSGAHGIELDVHASADGVLVACHDATLEATTNGRGAIAAHSFEELARLDNAYNFVPGLGARPGLAEDAYPLRHRAPAERTLGVARIDEVLASFPEAFFNLDIKQTAPAVRPYEAALARLLARCGRAERVIVASFHGAALEAFAREAPGVALAAPPGAVRAFKAAVEAGRSPAPAVARYAALQVPTRFAGVEVVDGAFVEAAHRCGVAVHVWTVDDEAEMRRLVGLGVDGIMSDVPSRLVAVLGELGVAWRAPRR
ncbi:MAG TPA: glycerophosphodiester phosphodiesterase [Acidimicrobiales bacterium]|nr:glycerophosphodiester phosphodiesterase [Acidimicrobiales bacterium]